MPPNDDQHVHTGYILPGQQNRVIQPLDSDGNPLPPNPAIDLIRRKLDSLFADEPDAAQEQKEAETVKYRSKHQQYMYQLSNSGKSMAEIQAAWHDYYQLLPDHEKHAVWQEFYSSNQAANFDAPETHVNPLTDTPNEDPAPSQHKTSTDFPKPKPNTQPELSIPKPITTSSDATVIQPTTPARAEEPVKKPEPLLFGQSSAPTVVDIRDELLTKVRSRNKPTKKQHGQSLIFGLSMGLVMVGVLSFGFFNERFIAPFITPSRAVSSTPLIIDPTTAAVGSNPEIIIPKINVEIPVVYDVQTIEESAVQAGLERGVVHYATTPLPGEKGNGVIFGHSANNILNKGKYKFAFVLLRKLDINDTFYIQKDGKRYVYRIFEKKIVPPTDLSVLNPTDKPATFTLITCDPPGTSLNRLVIVGEQISPDPINNKGSTVVPENTQPKELPSNSPTLWSRLTGWISD